MDGSRFRAIARGIALFLGLFTLLNLLAELRSGFDANLWWIDLRPAPAWLSRLMLAATAATLLHFGLRRVGRWTRALTLGVGAVLLLTTLANAAQFYRLVLAGGLTTFFPVPLSLWLAGAIAVILAAAWRTRPADRLSDPPKAINGPLKRTLRGTFWLIGSFLASAVLFPLGQMICFGSSDYRRPADAAVVFGARAHADGHASDALRDRVEIACELYRQGLVRTLIFSGGPGDGAVHETQAMRALALRWGVAERDILLDPQGLNTAETVVNTTKELREHGLTRVLAVSHFYHLPRIKMTYQRYGVEVWTVPVRRHLVGTPKFVAREVAALWVYYLRMVVGG